MVRCDAPLSPARTPAHELHAMKTIEKSERRTSLFLFLVFALLAGVIVTAGLLYCRTYQKNYRRAVEDQLSIIADLKTSELAQWRKERMQDGHVLFGNAALVPLVRQVVKKPDDVEAQRQLLDWMGRLSQDDQYDRVWLLDAQGGTRLSVPGGPSMAASLTLQRASEVLRSDQPAFQDFYRDENDQRVYLAVMVPVPDGHETSRPVESARFLTPEP